MLADPPAPVVARLIRVATDVKLQVQFLRRNTATVAELIQVCKANVSMSA
jgi:hypothetical protein